MGANEADLYLNKVQLYHSSNGALILLDHEHLNLNETSVLGFWCCILPGKKGAYGMIFSNIVDRVLVTDNDWKCIHSNEWNKEYLTSSLDESIWEDAYIIESNDADDHLDFHFDYDTRFEPYAKWIWARTEEGQLPSITGDTKQRNCAFCRAKSLLKFPLEPVVRLLVLFNSSLTLQNEPQLIYGMGMESFKFTLELLVRAESNVTQNIGGSGKCVSGGKLVFIPCHNISMGKQIIVHFGVNGSSQSELKICDAADAAGGCQVLAMTEANPLKCLQYQYFWVHILSMKTMEIGLGRWFGKGVLLSGKLDGFICSHITHIQLIHDNPKNPIYIRVHRNTSRDSERLLGENECLVLPSEFDSRIPCGDGYFMDPDKCHLCHCCFMWEELDADGTKKESSNACYVPISTVKIQGKAADMIGKLQRYDETFCMRTFSEIIGNVYFATEQKSLKRFTKVTFIIQLKKFIKNIKLMLIFGDGETTSNISLTKHENGNYYYAFVSHFYACIGGVREIHSQLEITGPRRPTDVAIFNHTMNTDDRCLVFCHSDSSQLNISFAMFTYVVDHEFSITVDFDDGNVQSVIIADDPGTDLFDWSRPCYLPGYRIGLVHHIYEHIGLFRPSMSLKACSMSQCIYKKSLIVGSLEFFKEYIGFINISAALENRSIAVMGQNLTVEFAIAIKQFEPLDVMVSVDFGDGKYISEVVANSESWWQEQGYILLKTNHSYMFNGKQAYTVSVMFSHRLVPKWTFSKNYMVQFTGILIFTSSGTEGLQSPLPIITGYAEKTVNIPSTLESLSPSQIEIFISEPQMNRTFVTVTMEQIRNMGKIYIIRPNYTSNFSFHLNNVTFTFALVDVQDQSAVIDFGDGTPPVPLALLTESGLSHMSELTEALRSSPILIASHQFNSSGTFKIEVKALSGLEPISKEVKDSNENQSNQLANGTIMNPARLSVGLTVPIYNAMVLTDNCADHFNGHLIELVAFIEEDLDNKTLLMDFGDGSALEDVILQSSGSIKLPNWVTLKYPWGRQPKFAAVVSHAYTTPGVYWAQLIVRDSSDSEVQLVIFSRDIKVFDIKDSLDLIEIYFHLDADALGSILLWSKSPLSSASLNCTIGNMTMTYNVSFEGVSELPQWISTDRIIDQSPQLKENLTLNRENDTLKSNTTAFCAATIKLAFERPVPSLATVTVSVLKGNKTVSKTKLVVMNKTRGNSRFTIKGGGHKPSHSVFYRSNQDITLVAKYPEELGPKDILVSFKCRVRDEHGHQSNCTKAHHADESTASMSLSISADELNPGLHVVDIEAEIEDKYGLRRFINGNSWIQISSSTVVSSLHTPKIIYFVNETIKIFASKSGSPNWDELHFPEDGLKYWWACFKEPHHVWIRQEIQHDLDDCLTDTKEKLPSSFIQLLQLPASRLKLIQLPEVFYFHVIALNPETNETTLISINISIITGADPSIEIVCLINCNPVIRVDTPLLLTFNCSNCGNDEELMILWTFNRDYNYSDTVLPLGYQGNLFQVENIAFQYMSSLTAIVALKVTRVDRTFSMAKLVVALSQEHSNDKKPYNVGASTRKDQSSGAFDYRYLLFVPLLILTVILGIWLRNRKRKKVSPVNGQNFAEQDHLSTSRDAQHSAAKEHLAKSTGHEKKYLAKKRESATSTRDVQYLSEMQQLARPVTQPSVT